MPDYGYFLSLKFHEVTTRSCGTFKRDLKSVELGKVMFNDWLQICSVTMQSAQPISRGLHLWNTPLTTFTPPVYCIATRQEGTYTLCLDYSNAERGSPALVTQVVLFQQLAAAKVCR